MYTEFHYFDSSSTLCIFVAIQRDCLFRCFDELASRTDYHRIATCCRIPNFTIIAIIIRCYVPLFHKIYLFVYLVQLSTIERFTPFHNACFSQCCFKIRSGSAAWKIRVMVLALKRFESQTFKRSSSACKG